MKSKTPSAGRSKEFAGQETPPQGGKPRLRHIIPWSGRGLRNISLFHVSYWILPVLRRVTCWHSLSCPCEIHKNSQPGHYKSKQMPTSLNVTNLHYSVGAWVLVLSGYQDTYDKTLLKWDFQHTCNRNPFEVSREQHSLFSLSVDISTAELQMHH